MVVVTIIRMSSTPQPNVRESPADIEARLANLGLAPQVLREALEYGRTHWMECTEAHPVGFAGMMVWGMTTYMLREGLAPSGWRAETHQGYSLTIHPEGKLAIMSVTDKLGRGGG